MRKLIQIVLMGQPELDTIPDRHELRHVVPVHFFSPLSTSRYRLNFQQFSIWLLLGNRVNNKAPL